MRSGACRFWSFANLNNSFVMEEVPHRFPDGTQIRSKIFDDPAFLREYHTIGLRCQAQKTGASLVEIRFGLAPLAYRSHLTPAAAWHCKTVWICPIRPGKLWEEPDQSGFLPMKPVFSCAWHRQSDVWYWRRRKAGSSKSLT